MYNSQVTIVMCIVLISTKVIVSGLLKTGHFLYTLFEKIGPKKGIQMYTIRSIDYGIVTICIYKS